MAEEVKLSVTKYYAPGFWNLDSNWRSDKHIPRTIVAAIRSRLIYRFRAVARLAAKNSFWLVDEDDTGNIVEKTVKMLTSTKKKGKESLLSIKDKGILCTAVEYRTEEEKKRLGKIIGGLKCFRRYPNQVKNKLAGVTYFVYYPPGRTIVREKQEAHATYLVISGEVNVSIVAFDPLFQEYHVKNLASMGPGDMFGEVSLLHDIPRTATITTITDCEFLQIKKVDFERVLKASVKEQWDKTQELMKLFEYFDNWDEVAVRECCILSRIMNFKEGQIVMREGDTNKNFVFFLTSGRCKLIEKMQIGQRRDMWGVPQFTYCGKKKSAASRRPTLKLSDEELFILKKPTTFEPPIIIEAKRKKKSTEISPKVNTRWLHKLRSRYSFIPEGPTTPREDSKDNGASGTTNPSKPEKRRSTVSGKWDRRYSTKARRVSGGKSLLPSVGSSTLFEYSAKLEVPPEVKTFFMQVCIFEKKACFGLGEHMKNRFVVADTPVECLLIPRYWISQKNYQKIWDRIVGFMNRTIPDSEKIYHRFVEHRRWLIYRMKLFTDIYSRKGSIFNTTCVTDIPYSIRTNSEIDVQEMYSYNYKSLTV